MTLKTIIVDDEKPSREALSNYIHDYCPSVEIVAACNSVKTAHKAILKYSPQLIFLDIEMPNGNGFELLRLFSPLTFKVIFVTAYSEYALKAFRFSATDYLLKPVMVDELVEAVEKASQEISRETGGLNLQKLIENLFAAQNHIRQLVIPDSNGFRVVEIDNIIMCEADGYCTHFYFSAKERLTSSKNLKYYQDLLGHHDFVRVHNSYLVNALHVKSYSNQGDIILSGKLKCPLGNAYKHGFIERFRKLK
jgi:two-component system, LytTR family, response regulator